MDVVCDEAAGCGAAVIGVLPRFMKGLEHPALTEKHWTETMSARKEKMRQGVSVAIALPGGIGTVDELVETLVLAKLGQTHARVILYDVDGYWKPLEDLLDHFVKTGMLEPEDRALLHCAGSVEDLKKLL